MIPPNVTCTPVQWCDDGRSGQPICSIVCETGSVVIDPWLANAVKSQLTLSRKRPLCLADWPGTHNSAITIVNGYGNSDYELTQMVEEIFPKSIVQTNDQLLSLTDQLRLGVRMLELDTHFVLGELRIAHCGGLNVSAINNFVALLNEIAHDLHFNLSIYWDTETIGCQPSLSAIPADLQRSLESAFIEINTWLRAPENSEEFVMFFFDDQMDLLTWGQVPTLLALIDQYFGDVIITPPEYEAFTSGWPSVETLVASGKQVLFMSGSDYGKTMNNTVFYKYGPQLCNWYEPDLNTITAKFPDCAVDVNGQSYTPDQGRIFRPETSEIMYGPFPGGSQSTGILNEITLPPIVACGINFPSADLMTPQRMASQVWSWASGNPVNLNGTTPICGAITASDSFWRSANCTSLLPAACQQSLTTFSLSAPVTFAEASSACTSGVFGAPTSGLDNRALAALLVASNITQAWIAAPTF